MDGSPRQAQCRRSSQGIRCWVGGLRKGFRRLAVQVGGRGTARRTALSPAPHPADLVLYELVVDRFKDGDLSNNLRVRREDPAAPHGGDLAGVRARLPFLADLGVNVVLLSPIWEHARVGKGPGGLPAWLGHEPSSGAGAERVSLALGSPDEVMVLLSAARRRGLRVVFDLPRPAGWSLSRYFGVVRTWVSRTLVDGVRIGPPRAGEERAWARETRSLADAFDPLVVIHRPGAQVESLAAALARAPASARILEARRGSEALLAWLGCDALQGGAARAAAAGATLPSFSRDLATGASPGPTARVLGDVRRPFLKARCGARRDGDVATERAARLARLALTTHLLLAEIPVLFYADGHAAPAPGDSLPLLQWPEAERSWGHRLMRRVLSIRRDVVALRRGAQQVRVLGDTLLITRSHGSCRVVVAVHRGEGPRRLVVPLKDLGWPVGARGADGSGAPVELVDRLRGRGMAAERGELTLDLEPLSVSVLTPVGQDACRG